MGTSSAFGGPGGSTPLVPSWLGEDSSAGPEGAPPSNGTAPGAPPPGSVSPAPVAPPIPIPAATDRFTAARNNFTRFVRSGGNDRASMGRAVSHYVSTASGGRRSAAQRMGASRGAGARLVGFLSAAGTPGVREALRELNLSNLAGRPIEEVFLGLVDYICPDGGSIDEGIAREAFIETIAELAENGIADIDGLSADQIQTIFELYATHAIEARLCNDIGPKAITLPPDVAAAERVQAQLLDFIRRGVADALTAARTDMQTLTPDRVFRFVTNIYEQAFFILETLGDAEAEAT
jgi:hypothetical protein